MVADVQNGSSKAFFAAFEPENGGQREDKFSRESEQDGATFVTFHGG